MRSLYVHHTRAYVDIYEHFPDSRTNGPVRQCSVTCHVEWWWLLTGSILGKGRCHRRCLFAPGL